MDENQPLQKWPENRAEERDRYVCMCMYKFNSKIT
jgi:hypothetical protein